jgi:hypothetical protein
MRHESPLPSLAELAHADLLRLPDQRKRQLNSDALATAQRCILQRLDVKFGNDMP